MNLQRKPREKKKWPLYCFFGAVAMLVLAGVFYFVHCQMISAEFSHNKNFFGKRFEEIYALTYYDSDIVDPIVSMGEDALETVGKGEAFGLLSRYCIDAEAYPEATRAEGEMEIIVGKTEKTDGYIWVAYYQRAYDVSGELVTASGSEDSRVLSRWNIEKIDGAWVVTEIKEGP